MRIAIIDLGTNSVRFDVQQLGSRSRARQIHREKIMVRLGQGVFLNGKLDRNAVQRTLHAFLRFKQLADRYRVNKIIAFGTSALREVAGRDKFLKTIEDTCGIQVRVISGLEEAQLIALGVLTREKPQKGGFALVDIGGGSTEISICRGMNVLHSHSFPLGTARLQQLFLHNSPPRPEQVEELRKYIRATLSAVLLPDRWPKVQRVIGSSGTIRALAKMVKPFERRKLANLNAAMSRMSTSELLGISGMESKRVDMILAGSILFEECMDLLGAKKAVATEFSLRDGILEEESRIHAQGSSSHLSLHLPDLVERAKLFGGDEAHLIRTMEMAESLFDSLARVHRLKNEWKIHLTAATLLRDTGEAISPGGHEEHSSYIVRHADLPGAELWETEWIAQLCRFHEGAKLERKELSFLENKAERQVFLRLLAMLQLVDALDSGPQSVMRVGRPKITHNRVILPFKGVRLTGLESLNVEKVAGFFRKVMGRELIAEKRK